MLYAAIWGQTSASLPCILHYSASFFCGSIFKGLISHEPSVSWKWTQCLKSIILSSSFIKPGNNTKTCILWPWQSAGFLSCLHFIGLHGNVFVFSWWGIFSAKQCSYCKTKEGDLKYEEAVADFKYCNNETITLSCF